MNAKKRFEAAMGNKRIVFVVGAVFVMLLLGTVAHHAPIERLLFLPIRLPIQDPLAAKHTATHVEDAGSVATATAKAPVGVEVVEGMVNEYTPEDHENYTKVTYHDKSLDTVRVVFRPKQPVDFDENVLVLILLGPLKPYGRDRTFSDLMSFLQNIDYPVNKVLIGFLVVDNLEFVGVQTLLSQYYDETPKAAKYQLVTLHHAPFLERAKFRSAERHNLRIQKERRRNIASARNYLLYSSLTHQDHVLWIDADIMEAPLDMLKRFIELKKDIVTVRVRWGGATDYDRNAWVGDRAQPLEADWEKMKNDPDFVYVPHNLGITKNMYHFMDGEEEFVELDSVGGCVLYVKAEVHRQGVTHTPYYAIGTNFGFQEGYDGIETEGLCYVAKNLGYKCWGMPHLEVVHQQS